MLALSPKSNFSAKNITHLPTLFFYFFAKKVDNIIKSDKITYRKNAKEGATVNPKPKMKNRTVDMTEGPILSKIVRFVLPIMATNILQMLYNAADIMVVSLSTEQNAVGAITTASPFVALIVNIFIGFSVGANVLVARFLGARDNERVSRTVHTSVLVSLVVGVLCTVLGIFISRPILSMMGAEGDLLDLATLYTLIYFCGAPFMAATNFLSSIFRAKGDTKTPLYVLSLSGIANVLLNLFFVMVCGMSVEGVAIATAAANLISSAVLLYILSKDEGPCRFSFKNCSIDRAALIGIIKEGLPAGVNGAVFSLSNMVITSSVLTVNNLVTPVGSAYEPIVKGNGAAANIGGFVYTAVNSVYQAAITFTSQNVGAKKYPRVWKVMASTVAFAMIVGAVSSGIVMLFKDPLLSLYGVVNGAEGSLEKMAYDAAVTRVVYVISLYFIIAWQEAGCGVVRGLGKSTLSMIISLIGACGLRLAWISFIFPLSKTLETIYISYPISWALTGIVQIAAAVILLRSRIKKQTEEV